MAQPGQLLDLHFPKAGIDLSAGFARQPNRPAADGVWSRTTCVGQNVRVYEPANNRSRGGSRSGLSKWMNDRPNSAHFITQHLEVIVGSGYDPPGGNAVQLSNSGRVVTLVAVCQGNVYVANPGDTLWSAAVNDTIENPPLNYTGIMFSAANQQKLYFADGTNWRYYDPAINTVKTWTATAGTLPVDSLGNAPRLICTWRGRTVLSGLLDDPHNWFMSAANNPHDFNYSPAESTPTQAVAGNNAPAGLIGDVVNTMIPYSDDILIFGGDHTIYLLRGDPMAGGQLDLVTDAIGMAWGQPWCRAPDGTIWFVSNRTGIYTMRPGEQPVRVSQPIEQLVQGINTGEYGIRCVWDDRAQGVHVFVTKLAGVAATTHYFYEARSGAWWTDVFANTNHNPLACCVLDGNRPEDRVVLLGGWDGYVRAIDPDATTDDGTAIASEVWIGPVLTKEMDEVLLDQLQGVLGVGSGDVTASLHIGNTAEAARASTGIPIGTLVAGRSLTFPIRRAGHALYVKLTASTPWAMEQLRVRLQQRGKVRRRGR